jgi:hypothetical protein
MPGLVNKSAIKSDLYAHLSVHMAFFFAHMPSK